ncbi:GDP-mannose 4,6-dehydratase [Patescibacteria group bacterium]|nr:GDP-mannose 4,6-dehydratase [Patescibacteria group bacterium]
MKLLITGGAGFIGSNFIRYWLKNHPKDQIVNLDALTYAGHLESLKDVEGNPNYKFIKGNIIDPKTVESAILGVDIIVHFAAESHVDRSIIDPLQFVKTNVLGTAVLLNAALEAKVKRFHHVSCYDQNTLAFTKRGLKSFNEIKIGDLVLSINPVNKILEWKPVEKVIVQDYKGRMIKVRTKTTDFMVTPNHRMLFQAKKSKKLIFKEAENMKTDAINKLPKYYDWKGTIPDKIRKFEPLQDFAYLLGIFIGDGFLSYQERSRPSLTGLSKLQYLHLARDDMGKFISIGMVGNQETATMKSWRIFLDIPVKDECRSKCEQSLTNFGINWHAHKGKAGEHIYFSSRKWFEIFKQCGKGAKKKQIPFWALNLPQYLLKELFLGLLDSDGSRRRVFYTSSKKLAHQFMELCVKLNFSPTLLIRHTDSMIGNRKIQGFSYVVSFGRQWRDIRKNTVRDISYRGKIWCLKVKDNKNFLTFREGRTMFCGNTDEVYGELGLKDPSFTENTSYTPRTPYSASKAGSDHLVRAYFETYGLPITITNCANNYGFYHDPEKLIPRFITNLLMGQKVPLMGQGENIREWLHVEDHAEAIDFVLQKGKIGETYLIQGEERTNMEITKMLLQTLNLGESMIEFVDHRLGHDFRYAINGEKLKVLGWVRKHSLAEDLPKVVQWYRQNEWWWKPLKQGRPNVDSSAQKSFKR